MKKKIHVLTFFILSVPYMVFGVSFTTVDGTQYKDAEIERVCPNGLDIGYRKDDGSYAIKFIPYKNLPENLRIQSGIDAAAAGKFDAELEKVKGADMDSVAEAERKKLSELIDRIKKKLGGGDVAITADELSSAVYAHRFSGQLSFIEKNDSGCVAKVVSVSFGDKPKKDTIQIDGMTLPSSGIWSGFLYPSGLKAKYNGTEIPVYTDDPAKAANLLAYYLGIYSRYTLDTATDAQASASQADTSSVSQPDIPDTTVINNYYYTTTGGYYGGYGIGSWYGPVWWYGSGGRPEPPPRPPKPEPPPRPPKPEPPDIPVIDKKPSRPAASGPLIRGPFDSPFTTVNTPSVVPVRPAPGRGIRSDSSRVISTVYPPDQSVETQPAKQSRNGSGVVRVKKVTRPIIRNR